MSYKSEGALLIVIGIVFIWLLIGIIAIIIGIWMVVVGASNERRGTHPGRCGSLGHDWRKDMAPQWPGLRCRNCLQVKGQPGNVRPGAFGQTASGYYATPPYAPGVANYGFSPQVSAQQRAAYAPPVQQFVCPGCGSPVQAGMRACPWCRRPF